MANRGWCGTDEQWAHFEAALLPIDPNINGFAARHALSVRQNERDSVGRSMRWGNNPSALLQLYLADPDRLTWNLWACCSDDRGSDRYWKTTFLMEGEEVAAFAPFIDALLERGFSELTEWREHPNLLTFATKIASMPKL
jgi:hypothetical protein